MKQFAFHIISDEFNLHEKDQSGFQFTEPVRLKWSIHSCKNFTVA